MELHLITGKDDYRPIMSYVKVDKKECVATNAHVLGVIPTTEIFDEEFISQIPDDGFLIHAEDWKKFKLNTNISWKNDGVIRIMYKNKRDVLIETIKEDSVGTYPKWKGVTPKEFEGLVEVDKIGINFKLGLDLQKAIGASCGLKLEFYGQKRHIKATPVEIESKAYGIVMPIMKI